MARTAKAKRGGRTAPAVRRQKARKPAQGRLPEMDDPAIEGLETIAEDYAEIRDQRQALTKRESELKQGVLAIMKHNGKTHYKHAGVEITIETEKEKVKVRVSKGDHELSTDDDEEAAE